MSDLINRDAFIVGLKERRAKAYLSELYDCDTEAEKQQIDDEMYYSTQSFIEVLMREPAVDAVQVVHGHWVGEDYDGYADGCPVYFSYRCSKCNAIFQTDDEPIDFDYCPRCGSKMDEKECEQDGI